MTVFRYRPTLTPEWLAVAAPGCMLAVRLELASERIESLVALTRGGSTVQGLLDALTSDGLTNTPSFVLAFWLPGRLGAEGVGVVARGEGRAIVSTAEEDVAVDAGGFASWTERHVDGATGITFDLGDPGASVVELEIDGGSVWASRISVVDGPEPEARPIGSAPAVASETAPGRHAETPGTSGAPDTVGAPGETADGPAEANGDVAYRGDADEGDADEGTPDEDDPIEGHTIARPSRAVLAARAAARAEADGAIPPRPPAPPLPPTPPAAPTPSVPVDTLGDHDGLTVLAEDLRAARQSGHLPAAAPQPEFSVQRYELELPSGARQPLDSAVVLGRAPSVAGVPASALPHLVTLTGDDISRNHVRVAVEGGTVVVTDLHSSNGTLVVIPGRAPEKLRGGEPTPVIAGTLIDLGSGVSVRVRESHP